MATRILCPYHPNKLPCHRMKVTIHFKSYFNEILNFLPRVSLRNDSTTRVVFMRDSTPFFYMNTKCKYTVPYKQLRPKTNLKIENEFFLKIMKSKKQN